MDSMIEQLAGYAAGLRYTDIPAPVVHECKRKLIDTLGCLAGGFQAEPAVIARTIARRARGKPAARILGTGETSTPGLAAFANGIALRYLDYNDAYFMNSSGHPSDVFAAVLAAADACGATGPEVITATTLGYEAFCNCSDAVPRETGWDYTIYGAIAAAVAGGKLRGFARDSLANAISLAIIPNMALEETRRGELAMWKGCAAANASRNGLFAAELAGEGMTGPQFAIEGRWGLWHPLGRFDWRPFGGRGGPFRVTRTHLKYYPAVVHAQSPIAAALELRAAVASEDIESLVIESYWVANRYTDRASPLWRPATRETADHSIPYVVAAALLDGDITAASFSPERIGDPRMARLLACTSLVENADFTRRHPTEWPCRIEATMRGGAKKSVESRYFKGHAEAPLSDAEVEGKFRRLAESTMPAARVDAVLEKAWALESLDDIGELLELLDFRP